tara:strand:+ start:2823 stop:3575 length:753 start_codon:yes stop_codon:yes gene_type:complete
MNVIILAAGEGIRLRPETTNIPKGMVKLFDKSLLEMQIDIFKKCNINDISIVSGYLSNQITFPSISYFKNKNYLSTSGIVSLFCAKEKLQDNTIITYSDLIFEKSIIDNVINFKGDIGITVDLDWEKNYVDRDKHPKSEAENVLLDKDGNIRKLRKNISTCEENEKIGEFTGVVKLSKKASQMFVDKYSELKISHQGKFHNAPSLEKAIIPDMLQELIDSEVKVEPILISGKWCEIDTPQDLEKARKLFT